MSPIGLHEAFRLRDREIELAFAFLVGPVLEAQRLLLDAVEAPPASDRSTGCATGTDLDDGGGGRQEE